MLGIHVNRGKFTIIDAVQNALTLLQNYGIRHISLQLFVTGPKNYKSIVSISEAHKIATLVSKARANIVIHGAYVDYPWSGAPAAISNIKHELNIADKMGATGVIVHLSSATNSNLEYVLDKLGIISRKTQTLLWLEINAAKPTIDTFETPQKITALFARIPRSLPVGLCIDTAHLHSLGVSLSTYQLALDWLEGLPSGVPIMIHLNDSAVEVGSGIDRHAPLCKGNIWAAFNPDTGSLPITTSGLYAILQWATTQNITVVLERNEHDIEWDLLLIVKLGFFC
jgi:endonuclease IV